MISYTLPILNSRLFSAVRMDTIEARLQERNIGRSNILKSRVAKYLFGFLAEGLRMLETFVS